MPTYPPDWRPDDQGYVWVHADLLRQLMQWITGLSFADAAGRVAMSPSGILLTMANGVYPLVLTGDVDVDGYYEGTVYANGIDAAATHTGQQILMPFDVDVTDLQGYYFAVRVGTSDDLSSNSIWQVVGGIPAPPATGTAYLRSVNGILKWIESGACT